MAEYKNGVNFRGNMSVEKNNVNPDVQTGRAIFVDDDKYEEDPEYKLKVDKCLSEGFHRVGSSEGGGSSDFSTANVTITKPEGKIVVWPCPTIISDKLVDRNYEQQELTETHPVALYKGVLEISALPGTFSIISGNVTEDEDSGTITITGDCSLQYTGF